MSKVYGVIYNSADMKELQDKCSTGETAVGITTAGQFFRYESNAAQPIFEGVVKEILGINDEQLLKLKKSKGLISPEELYGTEEVVAADPEVQEEFPEQTETATNTEEVEVIDDPPSDPVTEETSVTEDVVDEVHEPEVSKVEIPLDEYNRLLSVEAFSETTTALLETANAEIESLKAELSEIKNAASVIANIFK